MPKPRGHLQPLPDPDRAPVPAGFLLDDDTYNIRVFYTAATDHHGHKEPGPRVPLPIDILARAQSWLTERKVPQYRSLQDMLRDGLYHRLHWLEDNYVKDPKMAAALDTWAAQCRLEERRQQVEMREQYIVDLDVNCQRFTDLGALAELDETLEDAKAQAEAFGNPWSGRIWDVVQKYQTVLEGQVW